MEHDEEAFMEEEARKEQQDGGLTEARVNLTSNFINVYGVANHVLLKQIQQMEQDEEIQRIY